MLFFKAQKDKTVVPDEVQRKQALFLCCAPWLISVETPADISGWVLHRLICSGNLTNHWLGAFRVCICTPLFYPKPEATEKRSGYAGVCHLPVLKKMKRQEGSGLLILFKPMYEKTCQRLAFLYQIADPGHKNNQSNHHADE